MTHLKFRAFIIALIVLAFLPFEAPIPAEAATSVSTQDQVIVARSSSRRSRSSSFQKAIDALGSKAVLELPSPILLGKTVSNFRDTWGEARSQGRTHEGTDIFAPRGTFVVSPTDAVVTSAATDSKTNTLGGTYVYTTNPGGERFYFAHLDKIAEGIVAGKVLKSGDLIGYVGNTGNAAGGATHLHFGITTSEGAVNPYPRLLKEFTLKEKMEALDKIIEDSDDPEVLAQSILTQYRSFFAQAISLKIGIPEKVADILKNSSQVVASIPASSGSGTTSGSAFSSTTGLPVRDLSIGQQGNDVAWLQTYLITSNKGPAAASLAQAGATGYFGTVTQSALIEYQRSAGISPASGYFGSITRAYIQAH